MLVVLCRHGRVLPGTYVPRTSLWIPLLYEVLLTSPTTRPLQLSKLIALPLPPLQRLFRRLQLQSRFFSLHHQPTTAKRYNTPPPSLFNPTAGSPHKTTAKASQVGRIIRVHNSISDAADISVARPSITSITLAPEPMCCRGRVRRQRIKHRSLHRPSLGKNCRHASRPELAGRRKKVDLRPPS